MNNKTYGVKNNHLFKKVIYQISQSFNVINLGFDYRRISL